MQPRIILAALVIPLGLIIAAVPQNKMKPTKLKSDQLLKEAVAGTQFVSPDAVADMIIKKDPSIQLIDVRNKAEFEKFSLPGAINIPLADLLSKDWQDLLNQDVKMNIFYSNGSVDANEAWMITRQLGYKNNYVLQGGLNYWAETIMNPTAPKTTSPNDEIARYDFRKGASQALGGGAATNVESEAKATSQPMMPIMKSPKKKRATGGC